MKCLHVYALFLLFGFCLSCKGQNQTNLPPDNLSKGTYSESQLKEAETSKVPMSMVRNVKQASNGDILIASYLGVFRYDGTSFTNLSNKISSPRFASFWDVLEDRKGNLWFATKDSGVYCLPAGQAIFQHFTTKDGLASNMALHIYEDRAGNIWFGSSRYDPSASLKAGGKSFRNFTTKDGFPSNNIRLLLEDKTGKLWFGAQGEDMFVYDPSASVRLSSRRSLRTGGKTFTVLKNQDGQAFNNVWSVIEDEKGNIWFGADGLWRYDPSKSLRTGGGTFTKVSQRGAYAIIQDKKGNIWTTGGVNSAPGQPWALSRYDAKSLYSKEPIVSEIMSQPGMLLGMLEDAQGNIWFGSGSGVYRYDPSAYFDSAQHKSLRTGGKNITDFKDKERQK